MSSYLTVTKLMSSYLICNETHVVLLDCNETHVVVLDMCIDDRRYGGREEQRIPHVGAGAGAAQGVTGHLRALEEEEEGLYMGDCTGSTVTNDGASVPEVLNWCLLFVLIRHGLNCCWDVYINIYILFIGIKYAV
jgi:hypothetical protein